MKNLSPCVVLTCFGVFALGCAPRQAATPTFFKSPAAESMQQRGRTYATPRERVWSAAVQVTSDNGYPIAVIDKDTGILTTDWVSVDAEWGIGDTRGSTGRLPALAVLPPTKSWFGEVGIWMKCRYKFSIRVDEASADSTRLQITPHIECWEKQQRKEWTPCESTGLLEEQFFQAVEEKLAPR
jgi:hypothetical protein